jgi:uncharacterized membrane protein (DUF2068 family)
MTAGTRDSSEWTDALARTRPRAVQRLRPDEREFAPALRAIERAKRLGPQLQMLSRLHTLLGAAALGLAAVATLLLSGALLFSPQRPVWAFAAAGALVASLAALGAPWLALGFGLRRRRIWARSLGVVCGAVLLPFAPIGTALGVWTLVVVLLWEPRLARAAGAE